MPDIAQQEFIEDNLLVISKQTYELLQSHKDYIYLLSLYLFYYNTAKWQKTNQPRCTVEYTASGCHMNKDTVRKFKKVLIEMGLIEDIKVVDEKTGKVVGWFIKLKYIWKQENIEAKVHPPFSPEGGLNQRVDKEVTNALSVNKQNALSVNKKASMHASSTPQNNFSSKQNSSWASCPLNPWYSGKSEQDFSLLREKNPNGHRECEEFLRDVEVKRKRGFIDFKQALWKLHDLLEAGLSYEEIGKYVLQIIKRYDNKWDMAQLKTWIEKGGEYGKNTGQSGRRIYPSPA